jgi:hypothetical protein
MGDGGYKEFCNHLDGVSIVDFHPKDSYCRDVQVASIDACSSLAEEDEELGID